MYSANVFLKMPLSSLFVLNFKHNTIGFCLPPPVILKHAVIKELKFSGE